MDNDVIVHNQIREDALLINGRFDYTIPEDKGLSKSYRKAGEAQPHYPLSLAVCKGSIKVLQILLELKADMTIKEADGYNILHMLLLEASKGLHNDSKLIDIYKILEQQKAISDLLMEESDDGLRPLEMAACLGLMTFTQTIMNTPGVYLTHRIEKGSLMYKWYDITEYEKPGFGSRRDRSPLFFLRHIDMGDLAKEETSTYCNWSVMQKWIQNKVRCNFPLSIVWMVIRVFYILLCFMYDIPTISGYDTQTNSSNNTSNSVNDTNNIRFVKNELGSNNLSTPETLSDNNSCKSTYVIDFPMEYRFFTVLGLLAISGVLVIFDILDFFVARCAATSERALWKLKGKHRKSVVSTPFFRIMHFVFCLSVCWGQLTELLNFENANAHIQRSHAQKGILAASWSCLYFIQLQETIGYLVVILEKLIMDTLRLILLFMVMFLPFVHVFLRLYTETGTCDVIRTDDVTTAMYDIFLISQNMITFSHSDSKEVYTAHTVYILLINIILMNLIIAVYSETVSQLAPHRSVIAKLQRLSIMLVIEKRLSVLLYPYYYLVQRLLYVVKDKRIYIIDVSPVNLEDK